MTLLDPYLQSTLIFYPSARPEKKKEVQRMETEATTYRQRARAEKDPAAPGLLSDDLFPTFGDLQGRRGGRGRGDRGGELGEGPVEAVRLLLVVVVV